LSFFFCPTTSGELNLAEVQLISLFTYHWKPQIYSLPSSSKVNSLATW
jgi:hypothetical protein